MVWQDHLLTVTWTGFWKTEHQSAELSKGAREAAVVGAVARLATLVCLSQKWTPELGGSIELFDIVFYQHTASQL